MSGVTIEYQLDVSGQTLDKDGRDRLASAVQQGLLRGGKVLEGQLRRATTEGPVIKRTGTLQRSWSRSAIMELGGDALMAGWAVTVSSEDPETGRRVAYENILDEGGVIRPNGHKYLAIPIFDSVTAGGVTRTGFESPRTAEKQLGQPLVFVRNAMGKAFMGIADDSGKFHAYYVLKEQVRISPRHYKQYARDKAEPLVQHEMSNAVRTAFEKK